MKIDLLTVEEVKKLPVEILKCDVPKKFGGYVSNNKCWWWLRSPGYFSICAAVVDTSGAVDEFGDNVNFDDLAVRPIIRFNKKEDINRLSKTKKGYVKFLGTKWIDISEYLNEPCLLKKECLEGAHKFDDQSNDYETSKIKVYIEKWFKEKQQSN